MAEAEEDFYPEIGESESGFTDSLKMREYEEIAHQVRQEYNDNLSDRLDMVNFQDNHPMKWPSQWGKNAASPSYYYLQEPTDWNYFKMSQYTAYGFRIVWVTTYDTWNNSFTLKLVGLNDEENRKRNWKLDEHLRKIKFYKAFTRATGFDAEQGESIVHIHRMGEDQDKLLTEDNDDIPVNRLEAISRLHYDIPKLEKYGEPSYYRVSFYQDFGGQQAFTVHPSRAIRIKTMETNYEFYRGQSILKSVFPTIQALLIIDRAMADYAHRHGTGNPVFIIRGLRNEQDRIKVKSAINSILTGKFGIMPAERFEDVKMLGEGNTNADMVSLKGAFVQDLSMATGLPYNVLTGQSAFSSRSGEMEDTQYYMFIDKKHGALEPGIRQLFEKDPYIRNDILSKEDGTRIEFKIEWGLRHVRSDEAQVEYDTKLATVAQMLEPYSTMNYILQYLKQPSIEERWDDAFCQKHFGVSNKEFGQFPAKTATGFYELMITERQMNLEKKFGLLLPETTSNEKGPARSQMEMKPQGKTPTTKPRSQAELHGSEIKKTKLNDSQLQIARAIIDIKDEAGKRGMWKNKLIPWAKQKNDEIIAWSEEILANV